MIFLAIVRESSASASTSLLSNATPAKRIVQSTTKSSTKLLKLDVPESLWDILKTDHSLIVKEGFIGKLPSRHTITSIVEDFARELGNSFNAPLSKFISLDQPWVYDELSERECATFIRDIFDVTVKSQLLYEPELSFFKKYTSEFCFISHG